jgi:DedD protein
LARTAVSQEEIQLRKRARRRLVGAIALVLVAVVILPMVLDGEPRQRPESIDIEIPPIPAAGQEQGSAASPAAALPREAAARPQPPRAEAAAPAAEPEPALPNQPAPTPGETRAGASTDSLVIQIGCFADAGKSRSLATQIRANNIAAFSEPAPGRDCMRVRAGPFAGQEAAEKARERLIRLKLIPPPSEGKIVRRGD